MLDTDNGPEGMIMKENSRLYATRGIAATMAALKPGGTIVYWSVGDDPDFKHALENAGLDVKAMKVRAHVTSGPFHTLYVATATGVSVIDPATRTVTAAISLPGSGPRYVAVGPGTHTLFVTYSPDNVLYLIDRRT